MSDIMIEIYQIKINLIISILFLIQHNCILSRLTECIKKHLTSVAKDRTRLRRIYPIQNHNKPHTPGIIINYLIFYCIHILFCINILLLCDYILLYSFIYTNIPGVWGLL